MAASSPKYENLVLSNLNSPRFDISEFLKTPTDGSSDEAFGNLSGFNLSTPTFNTLTSLPSFSSSRNSRVDCSQEPDFTSLFDTKGADSEDVCLDNALISELIALDDFEADIALESCALLGNPQCNLVVDPASPVRFHAIYPLSESRMSSFNFPPSNPFHQSGSYVDTLPGSLMGVEERVLASTNHGASTSGGPSTPPYANKQSEWGLPKDGAGLQPNLVQHTSLPCDNCELLRRIIHSNGVQDTKLEIHGCDCQSYHAVLQTRFCIDDGFPSALEQQMVEFPVGNAEYVNQFLLQYSMLRMKEGFVLQHDSLQVPTDLGIGMNIGFDLDRFSGGEAACIPKQTGQSKMHQSSGSQSTDHNELSVIPVKPPKSNAAAQRERTGKLKMSDLAQFFHLPINAAAKELGICPTVLKKICRRNGMRRWPHRKIKSIERIIATLEQTIAEGAGQGDESIRMEIAMLKNERAQLCAGLLGET